MYAVWTHSVALQSGTESVLTWRVTIAPGAAVTGYVVLEKTGVLAQEIVHRPAAEMPCVTHWKRGAPHVQQTAGSVRAIAVSQTIHRVVNCLELRTVSARLTHPVVPETGLRRARTSPMIVEAAPGIAVPRMAHRVVPIPFWRRVCAAKISSAVRSPGIWIVLKLRQKIALDVVAMVFVRIMRTRVPVLQIVPEIAAEMAFVMRANPVRRALRIVASARVAVASPMIRQAVQIRRFPHVSARKTSSVVMFPGGFNAQLTLTFAVVVQGIVAPPTWVPGVTMKPSRCAYARLMTSAATFSGMMSV